MKKNGIKGVYIFYRLFMSTEKIIQRAQTFFEKMGIVIESLSADMEDTETCLITLKTPDSGILIGFSGKKLEDVRNVLSLICTKIPEFKRVKFHLEINDYLAQKDEKLRTFIEKKLRIAQSGKEVILPFFNAYERKKIHSIVTEFGDESLSTKSVGEWDERRIHIVPANQEPKELSIDLDSVDI